MNSFAKVLALVYIVCQQQFPAQSDEKNFELNDDTQEEQEMLSASFGPSPRQWPRIRVHPKAVMLDAGTESHITVHILFHPDKEESDVIESAIDILATEGSWSLPGVGKRPKMLIRSYSKSFTHNQYIVDI